MTAAPREERQRKRHEIPESDTWRLEDIFRTAQDWDDAMGDVEKLCAQLEAGRAGMLASPEQLADAMNLEDRMGRRLMSCYAFAKMRKDQNNADPDSQARFEQASALVSRVRSRSAFMAPDILAAEEETLRGWMRTTPQLEPFRNTLEQLLRQKPHTLPEEQERLLAEAEPVSEGVEDAFTMLDNVDIRFEDVTGEDGKKLPLTTARFARYRESRDRTVRRTAFENIHRAYAELGHTLSALYAAHVKSDVFFARARRHKTALDAALFPNHLDRSVYTGLIDAVHDALPDLHRYLGTRKRYMGLDELHACDLYVPLTQLPDTRYPFDEACRMVTSGVSLLGPEYAEQLERMWTDRWIDRYENEGKTSGAYAWGTYDSHPYMLLNFSGGLTDVLTLAHEAGHCMHTWYANRTQPHPDAGYPIFLAEIASTVNEILLIRSMAAACGEATQEQRDRKAYLLYRLAEEFRLTVFRQTQFAEFEWRVHEELEQERPLTPDFLCTRYRDLTAQYSGPDLSADDYMKWEWARVPHFYRAYYVFQYATGFCAAVAFTEKMEREGKPAVDAYLEFLSAGGSAPPLELLRRAGVDMSGPDTVRSALRVFGDLVAQLDGLLK